MTRQITVLGVALPGFALAAFGHLVHPGFLDETTARAWWSLHLILIPVFPLISVALAVVLRGVRNPFAWLALLAAYGFATFYTALDVLSGIGAGLAVEAGNGELVGRLFEIGDALGRAGVWMLLAAALLTGAALIHRDGIPVLAGVAVLAGSCFPFMSGHIFHPTGVYAMVGVGVGTAMIEAVRRAPVRESVDA